MSDPTSPADPLDYELLIRQSLRQVIRRSLDIVAAGGLPGEHFFSIGFLTDHPGVELPPLLREQYPQQMTIVLQHQFWDLEVDDDAFAVTLSFGGHRQRLRVPLEAVTTFVDPGAEFGLQLIPPKADDDCPDEDGEPADASEPSDDGEPGEVVSIDAFRRR